MYKAQLHRNARSAVQLPEELMHIKLIQLIKHESGYVKSLNVVTNKYTVIKIFI